MKNNKWIFTSFVLAFIAIPIMTHLVALVVLMLLGLTEFICDSLNYPLGTLGQNLQLYGGLSLGALAMFIEGAVWGKRCTRPELNSSLRYCLMLLPALLVLIAWIMIVQNAQFSFRGEGYANLLFWALPWWGLNIGFIISGWYWGMLIIPVGSQVIFTLGYYISQRKNIFPGDAQYGRNIITLVIFILALIATWQAKLRADKYAYETKERSVTETFNIYADYHPNSVNKKLTPLRGNVPFQYKVERPRLDGATALYPLYASAFYALNEFSETNTRENINHCCLKVSRTPEAYNRLIENKADLIFVAMPSKKQQQNAEAASVKLNYTPFAKEAFVFIVNADNPVNSLTENQVRDIFSGKITRWKDVGGNNEDIQIWQRPEDSGSQTVMLGKVMKNTPMLPAKETEMATGMGGVIRRVADYQNTSSAIGYTFRYYATVMNADKNIKSLAINGVSPTIDNIRNDTYPYTINGYMVTRENPTAETQQFVDWFLSPQGQQLVQDVGYVPLYSIMNTVKKNFEK